MIVLISVISIVAKILFIVGVLSLCKEKYSELVPYANYYVMDSLFKLLEELTGSKNRKVFLRQELVLRVKIMKAFPRRHRLLWQMRRIQAAPRWNVTQTAAKRRP